MAKVPTFDQLMNPLIAALRDLGGSGSVEEIYQKVSEDLMLTEEVLSILHNAQKSNQSEVEYRLAWARTYLKKYGILENSTRGIWAIKPEQRQVSEVNAKEVVKTVREQDKKERLVANKNQEEEEIEETLEGQESWRSQLHHIVSKELDPSAFERLVMRLLRESGFIQVEVTGRSGDGGIDGKGIARLHGFLSFHVVFQAKRYQGTVSAGQIRDFRGAMVGRADKGLFITTGTFTREALKEATRDGAPPIDLVDGDQLADKLKELSLGVQTEVVEQVRVNKDWYKNV